MHPGRAYILTHPTNSMDDSDSSSDVFPSSGSELDAHPAEAVSHAQLAAQACDPNWAHAYKLRLDGMLRAKRQRVVDMAGDDPEDPAVVTLQREVDIIKRDSRMSRSPNGGRDHGLLVPWAPCFWTRCTQRRGLAFDSG